MNVLISVDQLTDLVYDLMKTEFAETANVEEVPFDMVEAAIEFFNDGGMEAAEEYLTDAFVKKGMWVTENVAAIDGIVTAFGAMFDLCKTEGSRAVVEYDRTGNQAIVKTVPVVLRATSITDNLKVEYHNALERNDFFSERLRRAFEEISR